MKVYIGMSGGVDSSLSALLLTQQGYDATGVYMKNWSQDVAGMICPWAEDLADAKRVAVQLGIKLKVYDFQAEYKQKVVDYMVAEYQAGRTPNPDIMCNQEVKFKLFLEAALSDGADYIATGHYAQIRNNQLLRSVDEKKDQTYFLYRVTDKALSKTIFPVGGMTKNEVRELAKKHNLYVADKRDSQGICFVGQVGIKEFLNQYVNSKTGDIVEKETGNVIGKHDGAIFYTIGQRHGLKVGGGLPYYVTSKNMQENTVYVSRNLNDETMWRSAVDLSNVSWINKADNISSSHEYLVRLRHRGNLIPAKISNISENSLRISLKSPERSISPGQSAVIYDGVVCLGGGVIS
jgi:tRNA-specific 2-thiouridylase